MKFEEDDVLIIDMEPPDCLACFNEDTCLGVATHHVAVELAGLGMTITVDTVCLPCALEARRRLTS